MFTNLWDMLLLLLRLGKGVGMLADQQSSCDLQQV
jgi:hypothetical protein